MRAAVPGRGGDEVFPLGAFASSFLLYGIALIYGATGTTNLDRIAAAIASRPRAIRAVRHRARPHDGGLRVQDLLGPVHMWVPDVHQGRADERDRCCIATGLEGRRLRGR